MGFSVVGNMAKGEVATQVSSLSIRLSAVFTVLGIGMLYLYIAVSAVPETVKILWAGGLSIVLAVIFLIVWTLSVDLIRQRDGRSF